MLAWQELSTLVQGEDMSANQDRINQLGQQFNDAVTAVEARISGLVNQAPTPVEEDLDWSPIESQLARLQGDEAANPAAASAADNPTADNATAADGLVTDTSVSPLG